MKPRKAHRLFCILGITCSALMTARSIDLAKLKRYVFLQKSEVYINSEYTFIIRVKEINTKIQDYECNNAPYQSMNMICDFEADSQYCNIGVRETGGLPYFLATDVDPTIGRNAFNITKGEFIDWE